MGGELVDEGSVGVGGMQSKGTAAARSRCALGARRWPATPVPEPGKGLSLLVAREARADDRSMRWILAFALACLLAASCGSDDDIVVVTDNNSGSEISIGTGERFEVRLESNPSTGFSWQLDLTTLQGVVELGSTSFEEPADSDVVGAPGTEVFVLEAVARGAGVLRFEYHRPSDDPPVPDRVVEYIVRVDDAPWPPNNTDTEPPTISSASAPDATGPVIEVPALFDGEGPREAIVAGFVIWDDTSARLCETIMESHPPQCGGMWVVIADPEHLAVGFDEAQGVRWTANRVDVAATFDGNRLIIDTTAGSTEPTDIDKAILNSFLAFAATPGPSTAADLRLAAGVALGLGPEILTSRRSDELSDPAAWRIDRDEFRGWAGPFSALDFATEPATITVGAHPRCAAPPEPAPPGYGDHRRISIQPTSATSCLEWWSVDLFMDANGDIAVITLDLFAP